MKPLALSPSLRTLFADLAQQVSDAPPSGSVYERRRDDVTYLYAKVPVGTTRLDVFLGRKGDDAAEARAAELRLGMTLAAQRRTIVALLKRGGLASPDRAFGAALDAIAHAGLFRGGAVLVGTGAYMLSEAHVGERLPAPTLMTGDLDLAIANPSLTAIPPESMLTILRRADPTFEGVMPLDSRRPSSRFRSGEGYLVDLLTPTRRRADANPVALKALEAGAAPLQHLAWLIADPVPSIALWGSGVAVNIPQPARFAIHKLILAQRRDPANRLKRAKDLGQAAALIAALRRHDPFALEDALADARGRGQAGWAEPIRRSLHELGMDEGTLE